MVQIIQYMFAVFLGTVMYIIAMCFGGVVGAWTMQIILHMFNPEKYPLW